MKASFIILAGGRSKRMGRDKKFIKFKGKYFIEHVIKTAEEISDDIIISVNKAENFITNHKLAVDVYNIQAPLIGIYSALKYCKYSYVCILPCDAPLANSEVFIYMLDMLKKLGDYDGVVPRDGEYIEPLHAVYKVKPLLKACENAIKNKEYKLGKIIKELKIHYIPVEKLKRIDKNLLSLKNINTPKDLEELEKCA